MKNTARRTRFEGRVDLERHFLTKVNAVFGYRSPLAGMTRSAIDSWALRAAEHVAPEKVKRISKILLEASTRAELLADNSRDVFEEDRQPRPDSLEQLNALLETALAT